MSLRGLFESGDAWKYFLEMENRYDRIIKYVEFDKDHENVYSRENARTLIEICTYMEALFKQMLSLPDLAKASAVDQTTLSQARSNVDKGKSNMNDYREVLESYYRLSEQAVAIGTAHKSYDKVKPFEKFATQDSPDWWDAYNDVKHDRFGHLRSATLKNVVGSLAGLFLVNVIDINGRLYAINEGLVHSTSSEYPYLEYETDPEILWNAMRLCPDPRDMKSSYGIAGDIWIRSRYFQFVYMSARQE